jgi:hypothetical protein
MKACAALLLAGLVCSCAGHQSRSTSPSIVAGRIIYDPSSRPPDAATVNAILSQLRNLVEMVNRRDWQDLPAMVSTGKGLFIDLKGFRSHSQIVGDVSDRGSYIYTFYHDTQQLREATKDPGQICVRDVLLMSSRITVDIFMEEGDREVELQLNLDDAPKQSYRLNHPVFILEDGQWKVYRLF